MRWCVHTCRINRRRVILSWVQTLTCISTCWCVNCRRVTARSMNSAQRPPHVQSRAVTSPSLPAQGLSRQVVVVADHGVQQDCCRLRRRRRNFATQRPHHHTAVNERINVASSPWPTSRRQKDEVISRQALWWWQGMSHMIADVAGACATCSAHRCQQLP